MLINIFVDARCENAFTHDMLAEGTHSIPLQFREKTFVIGPATPTSHHRLDWLSFIQLPIITHPHGVDISSGYDSNGGNASPARTETNVSRIKGNTERVID